MSMPAAGLPHERTSAPRRRPGRTRPGRSTDVTIAGLDLHLTVTELPDGTPGEIFLRAGKQGSTLTGLCEALALTTTLALQHGVRVGDLVERLRGLHFEPAGPTNDPDVPHVTSLSDYLARRLAADYLDVADRPGAAVRPVAETVTLPEDDAPGQFIRLTDDPRSRDRATRR